MTSGPGHDRFPAGINVAAICAGTRALGPGLRAAVWVQGCPFQCPRCIVPEWLPDRPAQRFAPEALAVRLLTDPDVEGLTLSGGEPMRQAAALARLVQTARGVRDISVICFTGYRLEVLLRRPPAPGVMDLLADVDVLIDGPYVAEANDGRGLRGSRNQQIHHLTGRLLGAREELESGPRRVEVQIGGYSALLVGVPPPGVLEAFDEAMDRVGSGTGWRGGQ